MVLAPKMRSAAIYARRGDRPPGLPRLL